MWEMFDNNTNRYKTFTGNPLKADDFANPCGLVAKSYFNGIFDNLKILDTYTLVNSNGTNITLNDTGIANSFEKNTFFNRYVDFNTTQWMDMQNGNGILLKERTFYCMDVYGNV